MPGLRCSKDAFPDEQIGRPRVVSPEFWVDEPAMKGTVHLFTCESSVSLTGIAGVRATSRSQRPPLIRRHEGVSTSPRQGGQLVNARYVFRT